MKHLIFLIGVLIFYSCSSSDKKELKTLVQNDTTKFCSVNYELTAIDSFSPIRLYSDETKREQIMKLSENSYEQDTLLEKYYISSVDSSIARRHGDTLMLKLENGKYFHLVNKQLNEEELEFYTLNYIFKKEGFYFVSCQSYEWHQYALISMKTGEKYFLIGYPYFSPDNKTIISVSDIVCGDFSDSGIQIFENKNGHLKKQLECNEWFASYVKWIDNKSFKVARALSDENCNIRNKFYIVKIKNTL